MPKPSPVARGVDPFLATVCHDLRAPLSAVTMGASFVLRTAEREAWGERPTKMLEAMLRSCGQMERLIRNFADLAELERGSLSLELSAHDATDLLERAAHDANASGQKRTVTITLSPAPVPFEVHCDVERLVRALGHVIDHAVRRTPDGGTVVLAVARRGKNVAFSVADHGPELTPTAGKQLFDRRWQANLKGSERAGFELPIARAVVVAHHGRVAVTSNSELTTFALSFPVEGTATKIDPAPAPGC